MANRLIGVEITPRTVRMVTLGQHRGQVTVIALEQCPCPEADAWTGLFETMVPGGVQLSDRVIAALPVGQAYVRTLHFPFRERRKVLAAAPFELAAQLPVALEDCHTVLLPPRQTAEGAKVVATAVPKANLEAFLRPFEENRLPLQVLDLMPQALAGGLGEIIGTGVLMCINEGEATLACMAGGQVVEHRHFPLEGDAPAAEMVRPLLREVAACTQRMGGGATPVFLTGALATPQLFELLQTRGLSVRPVALRVGHRDIAPAFVPAAAMALRLGKKVDDRCFNLRQGIYAYHGEAAGLRKTLYGFGGLLGVSLLLFAVATGLGYQDKSRQAEALLKQITRQYQETFPGSAVTVDVPLQMQSKIQELRNRAEAFGIGAQPQVLPILKELSAVTARTPNELEELSCDEGACSLSGRTDSFDAVNRMKTQLEASALFKKVEVAETRQGVTNSQIEFRLRLLLRGTGGNS